MVHRMILSPARASGVACRVSLQIALHIFHPVLLQENFHLFPERHLAMMFGLALNVFRRLFDAGDSDAECAITLLPLGGLFSVVPDTGLR